MQMTGSTVYVNLLTEDSLTICELNILCGNRRTGEEILIDALLPDDRIATVFAAMRAALPQDGRGWSLIESWGMEEEIPQIRSLAA
ncbi:MAG TPA: hypothetical protein V6C65_26895 [Allocoleopsis sp.]